MKYISLSVRWRWLTVCMNDNCHGGERTGNSSLQAGPPTPSRSQRTSLTTTTDIEHFSRQYFISYASPSCREPKLCLWFILLHPADLVSAGEFLQAFRDDCSASHTAADSGGYETVTCPTLTLVSGTGGGGGAEDCRVQPGPQAPVWTLGEAAQSLPGVLQGEL